MAARTRRIVMAERTRCTAMAARTRRNRCLRRPPNAMLETATTVCCRGGTIATAREEGKLRRVIAVEEGEVLVCYPIGNERD
ncbi:unnamed protein product [Linum trigynum]|uniref:Uncharacterized protein n=1 Tax=Linum trigynum TaxID=586398 RepID=A0AAV2DF10_9ROSI